eukprot:SAG22_NODE_7224_length_760_cov_0.918306_1_plen_46_part_10
MRTPRAVRRLLATRRCGVPAALLAVACLLLAHRPDLQPGWLGGGGG